MGLRKVFGLLAMLTMANLALVGSELACDRHAGGHAAAEMTHGSHHPEGTKQDKGPCKVPSRTDCCQAVTSCAPSLSLAAAVASFEGWTAHSHPPRSIEEAALTRLIPPDPPPPKA